MSRVRSWIVPAVLIPLTVATDAGAATRTPATLGQLLPAAYARSAKLWPDVDEDGFAGRDIAKALDQREVRSVTLAPGAFAARMDTLVERRHDDAIDPRQAVRSSFRSGRDTLRFTFGHIAEAFGGIPRLIFSSPGAARREYPLAPLAHWNVDAVWRAGDYLIFGCTFEPEGDVSYEQIALWHLPSGRWYTTPREETLQHRGFRLDETFPEWPIALADADDKGAVVLLGPNGGLVLSPGTGGWGLVDKTGRGIAAPAHGIARALVPITPPMRDRLRAPLLAAFRVQNAAIDSIRLLEVLREPCLGHRGLAVVAAGTAPGPAITAQTSNLQESLNRQLFGVFLADSAATKIETRLDIFPTSRYGDFIVYFDLDAPDAMIGIYGQGEMYGEDEIERTYPCPN
ncbi:MAG: hypothetical protein ACM3PF_01820 [Bacteroidota bacterium]